MNGRRIVWGGLVAGVLVLASGVTLGHVVLGEEYVRAFAAHRAGPVGPAVILKNTAVRLLLGFGGVWLYAGLRPRFGPGPRTAILAAGTLWLLAYLPSLLTLADFGILRGSWLPIAAAWTWAEITLGTLAGAWLYRETPAAAARSR